MNTDLPDIRNFNKNDLKAYCQKIGQPDFRAGQMYDWLFNKGVQDFDGMQNLPKPFRQQLAQDFSFTILNEQDRLVSDDGTTKILFSLKDDERIETVMIPTPTRSTVCVSTQAGCKFGCRFCASGIGGWRRNLEPGEILGQILHIRGIAKPKPLSHIVFMGVGEPMDNYENLMKAIRVINDNDGINIGARRITISTCGVVPRIKALAEEGIQLELAISLHGFSNDSRNVLMPVNKKWDFSELIAACREFQAATKRQITFEYILIKDVTCTQEAVESLKKSLKGLICKMNLIPYNPVSEFDHKTPSRKEIYNFSDSLERAGIHATVRMPRGRDVAAACGQLRHTSK